MLDFEKKNIVEVIEDGKIVRVSEEYARKEGLLILRKREGNAFPGKNLSGESLSAKEVKQGIRTDRESPKPKKGVLDFEELRKPLDWRKSQIVKELIENFHWHISRARRTRGMSRKQLAEALGEKEETLKLVENGIVPDNDFVLINKIQDLLQINLRKDGKNFQKSARFEVDSEKRIKEELEKEEEKTLAEEAGIVEDEVIDEDDVLGEEIDIIGN